MPSVRLTQLRELWIHTGTACNLECPFCLEGSRPGDSRLERITLSEIKPHLDAAVALQVERFAFTGGEPLIVKDIVKILDYALQLKPCLVLTNGTAPLLKRVHQLQLLKQKPHPLSFRVSLDHPDEARHDADRGWGNFKRAIEGLKLLHRQGFAVSVARHMDASENDANENMTEVEARYRELFRLNGLPTNLPLNALPEFGRLGIASNTSTITDADLAHCRTTLMCSETRMVVKRGGQMRLHACPLTDDDEHFDTGANLADSVQQSVNLQHHRCGQCVYKSARL